LDTQENIEQEIKHWKYVKTDINYNCEYELSTVHNDNNTKISDNNRSD